VSRSLRFKHYRLAAAFLVFLFVSSIFIALIPVVPEASAADPYNPFPFKWNGFVAGGGESLLTYDIFPGIPGEEVIHGGGSVAPNSGGRVTCLRGDNGQEIWRRSGIVNLGDTAQLTMVDLDNDGNMEIVVPLQHPAGIYILNAEDGSTFYSDSNLDGGRIDSSPVAGDTDDDGYPDLYIGVMAWADESFGYEPSTGKVIHYEWNGFNLVERNRVEVWHPCAGGLSLCDTDNDGTVELYMNERDVYFGDGSWGRGIVSFWAYNLTVRWQVYDWGPSSNIPMIADVNRDGILDIISTDLRSGVCVLNSSNGQPLRNDDGTLLSATNLPRYAHYQSSIFDIDRDGNLELLSACGFESPQSPYATVWDLWDWTLDATIDTRDVPGGDGRAWKGPTVGEVTGDGNMDILITTFDIDEDGDPGGNDGTLQIYEYFDNGSYLLTHVMDGLQYRPIDSVVQDIDDDGLNEVMVLTQSGRIYCWDTPGIAASPRARSEVQFYGERRLGASEYVPYERPWADIVPTDPFNGEVGVSTGIGSLSFNLQHPESELMDYEVAITPDVLSGSGSGTGVGNGVHSVGIVGLAATTEYNWNITITDQSGHVFTKYYWFETAPYIPNVAPTQGTPGINGTDRLDDIVAFNQTTSDSNGDEVVNVYNWQESGSSIANLYLPFETQTPDR
jgi:hypothetical protein